MIETKATEKKKQEDDDNIGISTKHDRTQF